MKYTVKFQKLFLVNISPLKKYTTPLIIIHWLEEIYGILIYLLPPSFFMFVKNFEIIKHEFDTYEDYIHVERTDNKNEAKVFETKNNDITKELEDFCHFVKWVEI